jgi:hypothetical protein
MKLPARRNGYVRYANEKKSHILSAKLQLLHAPAATFPLRGVNVRQKCQLLYLFSFILLMLRAVRTAYPASHALIPYQSLYSAACAYLITRISSVTSSIAVIVSDRWYAWFRAQCCCTSRTIKPAYKTINRHESDATNGDVVHNGGWTYRLGSTSHSGRGRLPAA